MAAAWRARADGSESGEQCGEHGSRVARDDVMLVGAMSWEPTRLAACAAGSSLEVVRVLAWSPDGRLLLVHDNDGSVCVIELDGWRLIRRLGDGRFARFWPDGRGLIFADDNGVHIVDPAAGWERRTIAMRGVRAVAFDRDERLAIAGTREIAVWRWRHDPAEGPERTFEHRVGFEIALAFSGSRLVGYSRPAVDSPELRLDLDVDDAASSLTTTALPAASPPSRVRLLEDGSAFLRTHVRRGKVVLEVFNRGAGRDIVLPGSGYASHIAATPDGSTVVVEIGPSNGPAQLVALTNVPSTDAVPRVIGNVSWGLRELSIAPTDDAIIYDVNGSLWHQRLVDGAPARAPMSSVFISAAAAPAPAALIPSASVLEPIGVNEGRVTLRAPIEARTRALLVAGRAIDSYLPTRAQVAAIRALLARQAPDLIAVVAGDETVYAPEQQGPEDSLYARVVIGLAIAEADCDLGPRGPIAIADLRAALNRTAALGDVFWRGIASILATRPASFSASERRAAMAGQRIATGFDDVALDANELVAIADRVHLIPTGPLAYGKVVVGTPGPMPDDGIDPEEAQHWHCGQDSHQEGHSIGVRGEAIARADAHGLGTHAIDLDVLEARLAGGGVGLYVIARYD